MLFSRYSDGKKTSLQFFFCTFNKVGQARGRLRGLHPQSNLRDAPPSLNLTASLTSELAQLLTFWGTEQAVKAGEYKVVFPGPVWRIMGCGIIGHHFATGEFKFLLSFIILNLDELNLNIFLDFFIIFLIF